jgi:hypothetical protein
MEDSQRRRRRDDPQRDHMQDCGGDREYNDVVAPCLQQSRWRRGSSRLPTAPDLVQTTVPLLPQQPVADTWKPG